MRALPHEGDEFPVEVDIGRTHSFPVIFDGRQLPFGDGRGELFEGVRRLAQPPDDGALDEAAGAVDVLDVLDGQDPDEDAPVQLVDEQPLMGEQPERLAECVARHTERPADAVLREPGSRREIALRDTAPEDVRDAFRGARTAQEGAVVGQSRQLLCHARNSTADTRTKQHGY